jgi:hypothetical protein
MHGYLKQRQFEFFSPGSTRRLTVSLSLTPSSVEAMEPDLTDTGAGIPDPLPGLLETVGGLYCKRPIQCLASSELLTPTPSPPGECAGGGRTHSLGGEGAGGQ